MAFLQSSSPFFQHQKNPNSVENRASRRLYVGNLDPSVTKFDLCNIFNPVSPVVYTWICNTGGDHNYGFVHFEDSEQASTAMEVLNCTLVKGNPIKIAPSYRNEDITEPAILLVKNLEASIDDKSLHDTFADFGTIVSCKVVTDRSGQSKRYGFVRFEQKKAAQNAIKGLNGALKEEKQLCVYLFIHSEERNQLAIGTQKFTTIYVGNISETTTVKDIKKAFRKFGYVTKAKIIRDRNKNSTRCFGFVDFRNPDNAVVALEKFNGVTANDNKIWHVEKAHNQKKTLVAGQSWRENIPRGPRGQC